MHQLLKYLQKPWYAIIRWYYRKPRNITKRGIKIKLNPSVFHPSIYWSTDLLLDYAMSLPLAGMRVLELGCGSGWISLYLAKNTDAEIHASDINPNAISGIRESAKMNQAQIISYESDLMQQLPKLHWDTILINPPYFAKDIDRMDEYAFYTGPNHEYFRALFPQLRDASFGRVIFILSENVRRAEIQEIAKQSGYSLRLLIEKKRMGELFGIYDLVQL